MSIVESVKTYQPRVKSCRRLRIAPVLHFSLQLPGVSNLLEQSSFPFFHISTDT